MLLISQDLIAQNSKCSTMDRFEKFKSKDWNTLSRMENLNYKTVEFQKNKPNFRNALAGGIVNIPVVVHVLYNSEIENISDEQIQSQIDVLNEDFRLQNSNSLLPSHPFWVNATDCLIEFCLASQDENGNPSNGITRTYTDSLSFSGNDFEKFNETGGKDNWDPTQYLNIWVCNLDGSGGTLGYAQFPSDLGEYPESDGVVIDFRCFGRIGTAGNAPFEYNDLGRTATHEVGHWLNLFHIWGDDQCGDDLVDDTPTQEYDNFGCPQFPSVSCNNGPNGDMFMNYMDYVDDNCMSMFSYGQSERMDAAIFNIRDGLLSSQGCNPPTNQSSWNCVNNACVDPMDGNGAFSSIEECEQECNSTSIAETISHLKVYPNPSHGIFNIDITSNYNQDIEIIINNLLGENVYKANVLSPIGSEIKRINLGNKSNGIYILTIKSNNQLTNRKLVIQ